MAMRVWTFGVLLMLAGAVFLNLNLAQGQDAVKEIDGLLLKGKEELEPCREFRRKAELQKWKEAGPESPSHATKQEAIEALALLETYPGTPPSHYKARRLYEENLQTFSGRVDQISLVANWGSLETECEPFFMFQHARMLLKDMSRFRFAPYERGRVRTLIASYLKNERPIGTLIGVGMRSYLLRELAEAEENELLRARTAAFLGKLERRMDEIRKKNKEMKAWELAFFSSYEPEILATQALGKEYDGLLEQAKI